MSRTTYINCPNKRMAEIEQNARQTRGLPGQEAAYGWDFITLWNDDGWPSYKLSYENGMSLEEVVFKQTGLINYLMKVITKRGFGAEFKKQLKEDFWGTHYNVYFNGNYEVSYLDFRGDDFEKHHFCLTSAALTVNYDNTKGDL